MATKKKLKVKRVKAWGIVYKTGSKVVWGAFEGKVDAEKELLTLVLKNWRIIPCTITFKV